MNDNDKDSLPSLEVLAWPCAVTTYGVVLPVLSALRVFAAR